MSFGVRGGLGTLSPSLSHVVPQTPEGQTPQRGLQQPLQSPHQDQLQVGAGGEHSGGLCHPLVPAGVTRGCPPRSVAVTQGCPPHSVATVLAWRQEDAEEILAGLGFAHSDPGAMARVPPRFLAAPSRARGIDVGLFLRSHARRLETEEPGLALAGE